MTLREQLKNILGIEISAEELSSLTPAELKAERELLIDGQKDLLNRCDAEGRDLSSKEEGACNAANERVDEIDKEIERRP